MPGSSKSAGGSGAEAGSTDRRCGLARRRLALALALSAGWFGGTGGRPDALQAPVAEAPTSSRAERLTELRRPDAAGDKSRDAPSLLLEEMRRVGLGEVERHEGGPGRVHLSGLLAGESSQEIVLSAGYAGGAAGELSGTCRASCAVLLAVAADLARTPRWHSVRVMLFDRTENGSGGSGAWLEQLDAAARRHLLAHIEIDLRANGQPTRPLLPLLTVTRGGRREVAPGWLLHAVLEGMGAVGVRPAVCSAVLSPMSQLAVRLTGWRRPADSVSFLLRGVPSVLLSDRGILSGPSGLRQAVSRLEEKPLEDWARGVAAAVRRLDRLRGRPLAESEYLVAWGRVWLRRDLYWAGFGVWALLVWRGLPGSWRGARPEVRRSRGKAYLPGFAFRMLFLVALFAVPSFSIVLLLPAALIVLLQPRRLWARAVALVVALLPGAALAVFAMLLTRDAAASPEIARAPSLLVASTLIAFAAWVHLQHRDPLG